jgi:hypothetical protein
MYKTPNKTLKHNQDWHETDFEHISRSDVPVSAFRPTGDRYRYDCAYTDWGAEDSPLPARDYFRIAWRNMAANTGERTLTPVLIPPGPAHVDGVFSAGKPGFSHIQLADIVGQLSSLLLDFMVRSAPKSNIRSGVINRLPVVSNHPLRGDLVFRVLRLNCVTEGYAGMWEECLSDSAVAAIARSANLKFSWTPEVLLRTAEARRAAFVDLDSLVAVILGVTADELCSVYRTQFPVLFGYDRNDYHYDANGRLVPTSVLQVWRKKGDKITEIERTATNQAGNTYVYEEDMRTAHAYFSQLLDERS